MSKRGRLSEVISSANRIDDDRLTRAAVVCRFRRSVERVPDYNADALWEALRWARQTRLPVTPLTLQSVYQINCRVILEYRGETPHVQKVLFDGLQD